MRLTISEAKKITGSETKFQAFNEIYKRLEGIFWQQQGLTYSPAGMTWHHAHGPQSFHLTHTAPAGDGCVFHTRIKLDLLSALQCEDGNFEFVKRI